MTYYDFHSHILPAMDDGAKDEHMSAAMLAALKAQGVKCVVLSPHFYPEEETAKEFCARRSEALNRLMTVYDRADMPELIVGAEVAVRPGISRQSLDELALGKYIMLEMPFEFGNWIMDEVERILLKGFKPIFAHIERPFLSYRKCDFEKLIDYRSFIYQINIAALENRRLRKHFVKEFSQGGRFLLGSDCHNMSHRRPDFDSKTLLKRSLNTGFLDDIRLRSEHILNKVVNSNGNE